MDTRRNICSAAALLVLQVIFTGAEKCDPGFKTGENSNCTACPRGTYKVEVGGFPCTPCPQNMTTTSDGSVSNEQCLMEPHLINMLPILGPVAGGTNISFTFLATNEWNVSQVLVAGLPCMELSLIRFGATAGNVLTCLTSPSVQVTSDPVTLTFESPDGQYDIQLPFNYSYVADPVIDEVYPNKTIHSGGITLTVVGSGLKSVQKPKLNVTVVLKQHFQHFIQNCLVHNSSTMTCITPNLFRAVLFSTNSSRPINGLFGYHVFVGFTLDGVTAYGNISKVVPDFRELEVHSNPRCVEKDYVFRENEYLAIEGVHFNYVADKNEVSVTVGPAPCVVESVKTNAILCMPPQQPPSGKKKNKPIITVTFGAGPVIYVIGHLEYKSDPVWQVALAVCFCIAIIVVAVGFILFWVHKKKQKALKNLKRQPSKPNDYVAHRSSLDEGYLPPIASSVLPEVFDNRSSLASGSTTSGSSGQSRPSLEDLQKRASLASLTLSLVQQRSASISSIISSPSLSPSSPLSSILESGEVLPPTPQAPSVPMTNNMAYFLQPHKVGDLDTELPTLAAQGALIEKSRLTLGETIGKGFFGKVYKGLLYDENGGNPETVAVKTVQGVQVSEKDVASFLQEAIIMQSFSHENVLALLAVVMDDGRPYVVLPFMEHGDLKSYVSDASKQFTVLQLLGYGVQVASGMAYLTEQKFVHRDLACRNCMINKEHCVRIADFGLSRDVYYSQYYRVETKHRPLPVKWMAIESLAEGVFSTKSDVWSFGVLLWELLTRGCSPYADVNSYHIKAYLKSGRRLDRPPHATDEIYEMMQSCWKDAPEDRPTFHELQRLLEEMNKKKDVPDYLELIE